jgi:hypothetical protein
VTVTWDLPGGLPAGRLVYPDPAWSNGLAAVSGSTRTALAFALTGPPPRKRGNRPAPAIGPIQNVLDKLAGEPLTVWEIWTTVTDEHDSDASYAAVRDCIRSRRLARQLGRSPDHGPEDTAGMNSRRAPAVSGSAAYPGKRPDNQAIRAHPAGRLG